MSRLGRVGMGQLLDPQLGCLEALDARAVELLAAPKERDRLVDRDIAALEPRDDVLELLLELLETAFLAQGVISSTRAPSPPEASSISSLSPTETAPASRTASPRARTIA
jgi:hypothetical protein